MKLLVHISEGDLQNVLNTIRMKKYNFKISCLNYVYLFTRCKILSLDTRKHVKTTAKKNSFAMKSSRNAIS